MKIKELTRREFIDKGKKYIIGAAVSGMAVQLMHCDQPSMYEESTYARPADQPLPKTSDLAVSIVKIKNGKVRAAVEEAIDLLGGIKEITKNRQRIMLKPNLLSESPRFTTKPAVVYTLARLMKSAGKDVSIGEGSAAAWRYNVSFFRKIYYTKKRDMLDRMQQYVFDKLGYTELAQKLDIPLVNLHSGEIALVQIPDGLAYKEISLHKSLLDTDLLCSVPMMKTHSLAVVTLGMKNLIGLYPGTVYGTVRSLVHTHAADHGSPGVVFETLDMVRANKLGLTVIDGSTAMEGNGPTEGRLVDMNIIIAGTNPLATDMVAANVMGFEPHEIPLFIWANKIGMKPESIPDIEIRGTSIESVKRKFVRPEIYTWNQLKPYWGAKEI